MSGKGSDSERPVVILSVDNIRQETGKWCWLAVCEQIIRWKQGASPTQAQLAEWVACCFTYRVRESAWMWGACSGATALGRGNSKAAGLQLGSLAKTGRIWFDQFVAEMEWSSVGERLA
jgi:hypothetical protein